MNHSNIEFNLLSLFVRIFIRCGATAAVHAPAQRSGNGAPSTGHTRSLLPRVAYPIRVYYGNHKQCNCKKRHCGKRKIVQCRIHMRPRIDSEWIFVSGGAIAHNIFFLFERERCFSLHQSRRECPILVSGARKVLCVEPLCDTIKLSASRHAIVHWPL